MSLNKIGNEEQEPNEDMKIELLLKKVYTLSNEKEEELVRNIFNGENGDIYKVTYEEFLKEKKRYGFKTVEDHYTLLEKEKQRLADVSFSYIYKGRDIRKTIVKDYANNVQGILTALNKNDSEEVQRIGEKQKKIIATATDEELKSIAENDNTLTFDGLKEIQKKQNNQ
jgi:hypothetical protein